MKAYGKKMQISAVLPSSATRFAGVEKLLRSLGLYDEILLLDTGQDGLCEPMLAPLPFMEHAAVGPTPTAPRT